MEKYKQQIIEMYPNTSNQDIADALGLTLNQVRHQARLMKLKKSPEFRQAYYQKFASNQIGKFKKGHTAWNKGTKGVMKNGIETQFKKGGVPHNVKPIGHISKCKSFVTIKTENGYKQLHRFIWEQHHGEIPPHKFVTFKDGDKRNFDIDNLELTDRHAFIMRNHTCLLPKELQEVINIKKQITRIINNGTKQNK